jgi:hypothetical protein
VDNTAIYRKTAKGIAELTTTERTVDRRLRPLLILIDGNRTALHIHSLINGIGIRVEDFDRLETGGFIEPIAIPAAGAPARAAAHETVLTAPARTSLDRYADGKRYLCETATDKLGLRSFLFVLRIEKCASAADLMELLPEFERALARRIDETYGRHCRRIARAILSE